MTDDFSINIEHHDGRSIVVCRGALDLLPAEKLRDAVDQSLAREIQELVVDCREVDLLASAGITALVDIAIGAREHAVALDLRLSPHVRRVLDLVGLWWLGVIDDGISVHASLQRALRSYADRSFDGSIPRLDSPSKGATDDFSLGG